MLDYYSERLNGVELNASFYRTPPESTLAKWAEGTSPAFRFCMKAHRGLTYSADAFDRAFERLNADERALLVLRHHDELPVADIAARLGIPAGTVKSRLFTARRALERALAREDR